MVGFVVQAVVTGQSRIAIRPHLADSLTTVTAADGIAVVGVGWAGEWQVRAVQELGRKVQVECLVDTDVDFLRARAAELAIGKTYTTLQAALDDEAVDAASICTPHILHCPLALEAAAARKHILCEKPIALTVEDATRMNDAAERSGVRLYVAEN